MNLICAWAHEIDALLALGGGKKETRAFRNTKRRAQILSSAIKMTRARRDEPLRGKF